MASLLLKLEERRAISLLSSTLLLAGASLACGQEGSSAGSGSGGSSAGGSSAAGGLGTSGSGGSTSMGGATSGSGGSTSMGGATAGGGASGGNPSGGNAGSSMVGGNGGSAGGGMGGSGGSGGTVIVTGDTPVGRHGQLEVVGNELRGEHGQPVTLRGQGFGWDNYWPQYYNSNVVAWLAEDWCVDIVRPAMGIEPEGGYLDNAGASSARMRAVVDAAIFEGIYVIIDWHAHDMHQSEAIAFFTEMAQTYGDQPNVIYEIFNEPEGETWPQVKAYSEAVIAAIRQHDPDNIVIVGSPEWDQRIDEVAADPITQFSNIVYSVHFYAATHGDWLRDRSAAARADGIPILVSESSGSEADGLGPNDYTEWQAWIDFMDRNQISWLNYSISDKEGETISVLEPGASANGGWSAQQLTESGEWVRDVLRGYCQ